MPRGIPVPVEILENWESSPAKLPYLVQYSTVPYTNSTGANDTGRNTVQYCGFKRFQALCCSGTDTYWPGQSGGPGLSPVA